MSHKCHFDLALESTTKHVSLDMFVFIDFTFIVYYKKKITLECYYI